MNLAAILGLCFLSLGFSKFVVGGQVAKISSPVLTPALISFVFQTQGASSSSQPTSASGQNPAPTLAPTAGQTPTSAAKGNPSAPHHKPRHKTVPDCSNAPAPLNPVSRNGGNSANSGTTSQKDTSTNTSAGANGNSTKNAPKRNSTSSKPCPPPKKIVREGGSDEPKIELLGGTPAQQASDERSTEELTAATEENLKKIEERQLGSGEKDTVSQIRQFMEQSKQAVAAGDPERAHNLAMKARLLSEELLSP
jgi:hypothetical protein